MDRTSYFHENYDIISSYINLTKEEKVYIGTKEQRVCRFCDRSSPDVDFKKIAHAIPEFTGNKSLLAYDECDVCNEKFSRTIEDHLAKYLGVQRTLAAVDGKKGIPTYVGRDGKTKISMKDQVISLTSYEDDKIYEIDEENKSIKITAHKQPYIPAAAFKCFVKMAISVAPKQELSSLKHLITWVGLESHTYESLSYRPFIVFEQFTPGPKPYSGVTIFLLRRKDTVNDAPYMQFVIAFANTMFQIILPMPDEDSEILGKPIQLTLFPTPFDKHHEYGNTLLTEVDLSSFETIKNEESISYLAYESHEKNTF
ncbi:HNH endonuclease [Pseudoalteromonas fenneropenaei]|uniref:HNH endonuclease n=1 Tax=Pseudoalteromonas fenneropenaei TaxID=1737459 RepID=A0ABV7CPU4_9GAMM